MTNPVQQFGVFLHETIDTDFEAFVQDILTAGANYGRVLDADDLRQPLQRTLHMLAATLESGDTERLWHYGREIGLHRARDGFTLGEMMRGCHSLREQIWRRLREFLRDHEPWPPEAFYRLEHILYVYYESYTSSVGEALTEARAEVEAQAAQLEVQRQMIRELGAPILPVHEGVLVLPLVGAIDSHRAVQIMEALLEAITRYQAGFVILDITGVPAVDERVAYYIIQAARAAHLVGAHIILVGIGASIAQTIVHLDIDLSVVTTRANLQEGLEYAYHRLHVASAQPDGTWNRA